MPRRPLPPRGAAAVAAVSAVLLLVSGCTTPAPPGTPAAPGRAAPGPGVSDAVRRFVTDGDAPGAAAQAQWGPPPALSSSPGPAASPPPSGPPAGLSLPTAVPSTPAAADGGGDGDEGAGGDGDGGGGAGGDGGGGTDGGGGSWFRTAGVADLRTDRRIRADDRFRAGSLTKTFVSTVVLQLAAEGRLSLDDPVDRHLPAPIRGQGNDGRRITVRQLLGHTSGLFDYMSDPVLEDRFSDSGFAEHRLDTYTPEQLVRIALRHRPHFPPGAGYRYSNTDYILLGMVVEQVTGRPYAEEAERRLLRPLALHGTSFPGTRPALPAPHGRAYSTVPGDHLPTDVTALDPSGAGAAGEVVSTLGDLNRFLRALLGGRLLAPEQLRWMLDTSGSDGVYGLGLFPVRLECGVTLWGHNGRISGSYVQGLGTPNGDHVLSYRVNTDTFSSPRTETRLLEAEFCPERGTTAPAEGPASG